jgi:hypothetical protein
VATPERYWDREDHEDQPIRLNLVSKRRDPHEPYEPEQDSDPWAELGIAAVFCGVLLSLVLPLLT